jgi:methionyl aminopeptidase
VLKPGMLFTIEPMINAGKAATRELSDGWTVETRDKSLSAQWEHMVAVTETGFEVLTLAPGETGARSQIPNAVPAGTAPVSAA